MQKIISIIIATFNSERTLKKCLQSIIDQKDNSIEIIVVDNCSVDKTKDILKFYRKDIDHVISELDDGIYHAWNKGVKISSGKWIMFVGSDDELRNNCIFDLKKQINVDSNYDYICGRIMFVNQRGHKLKQFGQPFNWKQFRTIMNLAHVSSLHNRKLYEKYGYYDTAFKISGDYEFLLRLKDKLKVKFIDKIFANMLIGGISYRSFQGLKETRNAKLKNKVNFKIFIYFDYYFSVFKLILKKLKLKLVYIKKNNFNRKFDHSI